MSLYKFVFQNEESQLNEKNEISDQTFENLHISKNYSKQIKVNIEIFDAFNKRNENFSKTNELIKAKITEENQANSNNRKKINQKNLNKENDCQNDLVNKEQINKILLNNKESSLFQSIGIYYIENSTKNKKFYFNVLHRKILFHESNKIDNFFFQDVTDLINYQIKQHEENIKKQRIFAKISHEFKTPLNSIIGIINIIQDKEKFISDTLNKNLELVSNLSNYIIYLISDLIQYVNFEDIKDLKVNISVIDFKEMIYFCFRILNCLLALNKCKSEEIDTYLSIDENIKYFIVESDENRIKQIVLNFVSNSVKFTKQGSIKLLCKVIKIEENFFIEISVIDTGIGIKEADKMKLFKDFGMINYEGNEINNNFGTGLGLSICKTLIEKLELEFQFDSKFLKGSKFSILIPCKKVENYNNYYGNKSDLIYVEKNDSSIDQSINDKFDSFSNDHFNGEKNIIMQQRKIQKSNSIINMNNEFILKNKNCSNISKSSTFNICGINSLFQSENDLSNTTIINENTSFLKLDEYSKFLVNRIRKDSNDEMIPNKFIPAQPNVIICADDNHLINISNRKILAEILNDIQRQDIEIICVNDGVDIIRMFLNNEKNHFIKLIITDENMEYMSGSEAIKIIRTIESKKNLKRLNIISLSCHEDNNIGNSILQAGADLLLTKPLSKQNIKFLIDSNKLVL